MLYRPKDPARPLGHFDDLIEHWRKVAVLLFVADQRRVRELPDQVGIYDYLGVGSGVLVGYAGRPFLVTAYHVIEDTRLAPTLYAQIGGRNVYLGGVLIETEPAEDLAVAYLDPSWCRRERVTSLPVVPLRDDRASFRAIDRHLLLGYRGLENRIAVGRGEVATLLRAITADRVDPPPPSERVANPIGFHYDPATATDAGRAPVRGITFLNGMSGGPALEVLERRDAPGVVRYAVRLAGVLSEWHPETRRVVASGRAAVEAVLARFTADIDEAWKKLSARAGHGPRGT